MATAFCTEAEVRLKLSTLGVVHFGDDDFDGSSETGVVAEGIDWASEEIIWLCDQYAEADLATSGWINQKAIIFTIYWLCTRRGQDAPKGVELLYEGALKQLERVDKGEKIIPGVAMSGNHLPGVTNVRADLLYRTKKARVERVISTEQPTHHTQATDWDSNFDHER